MRKPNKIIPKICLLILLVILFSYSIFLITNKSQVALDGVKTDKVAREILEKWQWGGLDPKYSKCRLTGDLPVDQNFYNCNIDFYNCIESKFPSELYGLKTQQNDQHYKVISPQEFLLEVSVYSSKQKFQMKLKNNCHEKLLPKGVYPMGEIDLWDNYSYSIYVDKYYVTNYNIYLWSLINQDIKKYIDFKKESWSNPSVNLPLKRRKEYCNSVGKGLLKAHVFDAAVYFPNENTKKNQYFYRYPYPWTKNKTPISFPKNKKSCEKIYTKECENIFKAKVFADRSVSWIGINYSLGDYAEVFDTHELKENIKISNSRLPFNSPWHINGRRASWNGEDFQFQSFSNITSDDYESLESGIAFRCMRE